MSRLMARRSKANASKHKAMSYERMKKREAELKAEVARMLPVALPRRRIQEEDETFGQNKRGDEMPDWAGDKQKRLAKIQQAMTALEADARLVAAEERRIEAEKEQQRQAEGRKKPGKSAAAPPSDQPNPKSQRNFTDPESRIMKSKDGFVPGLQCTGRRRRRRPDHCRARTDAVRQRSGPVGAPDRGHREQSRPQAGSDLRRTSGHCSRSLRSTRSTRR